MSGYSVGQVLNMLEHRITYRQLDNWIRTGVITLAHPGRGPGSRRHVTESEAAAIRDLVDIYEQLQHSLGRIRAGEVFAELLAYHDSDGRTVLRVVR